MTYLMTDTRQGAGLAKTAKALLKEADIQPPSKKGPSLSEIYDAYLKNAAGKLSIADPRCDDMRADG